MLVCTEVSSAGKVLSVNIEMEIVHGPLDRELKASRILL